MSERNMGKRVEIPKSEGDGPSWIAILALAIFQIWPVVAILGFLKFRAVWKNNKLKSYRQLLRAVGSSASVSLEEISDKTGQNKANVTRALSEMIDKGYLGEGSYIDYSTGMLIISDTGKRAKRTERKNDDVEFDLNELKDVFKDIAQDIKREAKEASKTSKGKKFTFGDSFTINFADEKKPEDKAEPEKPVQEEKPVENQNTTIDTASEHEAILQKLRQLNVEILDEGVSDKIDRIVELTDDIYSFVDKNPACSADVRKFMNYYLPTTIKLLGSYGLLERQSYQGENIVASRKNIESILDTLVQAFEKQLDRLFAAGALDISSDIQVLETMIAKDGLTQQAMQLKL